MYPPGFNLLLAACRLSYGLSVADEAEEIIRGGGIDWDRLYRRADLHSVRPQLAQLVSILPQEAVPENFRVRINKAYLDTVHDQISYAAEFMNVKLMLEREGIMTVPFKGFRLAHDYYGDLGGREGGDIDLFTDFDKLERIRDLMFESGYVVERQMAGYSINELARRAGEYNFDKFDGDKCLYHFEFHWRISSPVYELGIGMEDLSSQVMTGTMQGKSLMRFTPSADMLLTVMHHGGKDPFSELKYVQDVASIMRKDDEINWEWVLSASRRFRMEKLIYVAAGLAHEIFSVPVPAALETSVSAPAIRRLTHNRIRFMAHSLEYWHPWIFINDWIFRIRTRSGLRMKMQLAIYVARVLTRRFLPVGRLLSGKAS